MDESKVKKIKIKASDGKEYTLAYDRNSCAKMSRKGFDVEDIKKAPIIGIPKLIYGAFLKFHPDLSTDKIDEIWAEVKGKEALMYKLMELYSEPIIALLDEPKDDAKNAIWEVVD